jgi:hypothetical protein
VFGVLEDKLIANSVSATTATQFNTGGTIVVAGTSITIPENLLVQFPAAFIPFADFAANGGQYTGFEISVDGNYVRSRLAILENL